MKRCFIVCNRCLIVCTLATAAMLISGTWSDGAAAQTGTVPQPAARKSAGRIACTEQGCRPVPRGCYVETESYGHATGYDKVVCPTR